MLKFAQRRIIAGAALLAFLFAIAFPALATVRHALDPLSAATICSTEPGVSGNDGAPPATGKLHGGHCVLCVASVSPPPVVSLVPVATVTPAILNLSPDRSRLAVRDPAALQPLNPRAPPRA